MSNAADCSLERRTARTNPRPGDAVTYDTTNDAWRVAHNAATQLAVSGILSYPADTVASASSIVQFESGDEIEVVTMGVVWVIAGGASERGAIIQFQTGDFKYNSEARVTAIANIATTPIVNFSTTAAVDEAIIKAAIGYGRVI